jgi:hypothetical protein
VIPPPLEDTGSGQPEDRKGGCTLCAAGDSFQYIKQNLYDFKGVECREWNRAV